MKKVPFWREYGEALVVAFFLAMLIRFFVVQAYQIPSGSMLNTLLIGDKVLVSRLHYNVKIPLTDRVIFRLGDPAPGDVVVFTYPDPNPANSRVDYIKRVIGVPGDVIASRAGRIYRNGQEVQEPYARPPRVSSGTSAFGFARLFVKGSVHDFEPLTVPPEYYFVLGDNRDDSMDSRFWGFVPREAIHGKAWRLYWSWGDKPGDAGSSGFPDSGPRWSRIGSLVQ
jgi:signal peptidase I